MTDVPVFVTCFNNVTYLRSMLVQLTPLFRHVAVIDNASTYPPCVEYLRQIAPICTVIRRRENVGPRDILLNPQRLATMPDLFCVTDPDLEFSPTLPDCFLEEMIGLTETHRVGKAGFALRIDDRELMKPDLFTVEEKPYRIWDWESQFWKQQLGTTSSGEPVYSAEVDCTFCVVNKRYFRAEDQFRGVRIAGTYACRHLPWYKQTLVPKDEQEFYAARSKHSHYI